MLDEGQQRIRMANCIKREMQQVCQQVKECSERMEMIKAEEIRLEQAISLCLIQDGRDSKKLVQLLFEKEQAIKDLAKEVETLKSNQSSSYDQKSNSFIRC
jgi:hypothetical protein